jgi:hypothetical protein
VGIKIYNIMDINNIKEFIVVDAKKFGYNTVNGDKFVKYNGNFVLNEEYGQNSEHESFSYSRKIILSPNMLINKLKYINVVLVDKEESSTNKLINNIKNRIKAYDKEISSLIEEKEYNPLRDQKINTYANIIKELNNIIENV